MTKQEIHCRPELAHSCPNRPQRHPAAGMGPIWGLIDLSHVPCFFKILKNQPFFGTNSPCFKAAAASRFNRLSLEYSVTRLRG